MIFTIEAGATGVYCCKLFDLTDEANGLITYGVRAGEEDDATSDNFTNVKFSSKVNSGKVTVTAKVGSKSISFTGSASKYASSGSVGFFSYSQPCATFYHINVEGNVPEYTITYNADGGIFSDDTMKNKTQKVELYDLETEDGVLVATPKQITSLLGGKPTKTGYHMGDSTHKTASSSRGWYYKLNDENETELKTGYYRFHKSITVKPDWHINTGTVRYNANGGTALSGYKLVKNIVYNSSTNEMVSKNVDYNTSTINLHNVTNLLSRTGYYIPSTRAWRISSTSGKEVSQADGDSNALTQIKNALSLDTKTGNTVTLYANWQPYKLTVKYNANGGSGAPSATQMYYGSNYQLSQNQPTRTGYDFAGWGTTAAWCETRYTTENKSAKDWASAFGTSIDSSNQEVTLYAQWQRTITYTFNYFNNKSATVSATFHNGDTSKKVTIPATARGTNKNYGGYSDWKFSGFSTGTAYNSGIAINADTSTLTINSTDSNKTYYAQYQRAVTIKYVDYGDNKQCTDPQQKKAKLNYNGGSVFSPTFTFPTLNTMKLKEKNAAGEVVNDQWDKVGWTTKTAQNASASKNAGDTLTTYEDYTYYGLYKKDVKVIYDVNGGTVLGTTKNNTSNAMIRTSLSNNEFTYTRYANAVDITKATTNTFTLAIPEWKENGEVKYNWFGWLYKSVAANEETNTFGNYLVGKTNNMGSFTYTPLISDTLYAYWNINEPGNPYLTDSIITKSAEWATPSSDNSAVDFDNKQNIDIDGIARVTVKTKITNRNGISSKSITVTDYFDTDIWEYYQDDTHKINTSIGSTQKVDDTITWLIPDSYTSGQEMTFTYYVKLKEKYWTVDKNENEIKGNTDYYINAIKDLASYKKELNADGSLKSSSTYQTKDKKSLIQLRYTIKGGLLSGITVNKYNSTPYVVMRPVNWIPTIANQGIGIESDTNNIYHNIDSSYTNTYFVRYDTKGANSTFRLYELSQLKRSYSYYQITDNLMDMQSANKTQEVIDNVLGVGSMSSDTCNDVTGSKLSSGFKALDLLKVAKANNIRSSVNTNGIIYPYGALTSYDTDYATNRDGLKISVYPFVRTTNNITGETYETTRNTSTLADKRLDLTIDATDPIITADSNIKTKSDTYGEWTESDGYIDINLVNKATNPIAATKELTFKFKDDVSGVNSPDATSEDWIKTSKDNVQVTLKRVDNEAITIFDSNVTTSNDNKYVKVTYDSTNTMNKTGNVKVTLDPTDKNILGHLQLTIEQNRCAMACQGCGAVFSLT